MILAKSASRVFRRQAERRGDRVHQIDVEADERPAAFVFELVGRVGMLTPTISFRTT